AIQDRQRLARPRVSQIMCKTIFKRLTFLQLVIQDFTHPEPGFCQHIVVIADVHGSVQITARAFAVARFCINDSTFQKILVVVAEHYFLTIASVIFATRAISFTSCTRMMSAPRVIPTATVAAVPSTLWSAGGSSVKP